LVWTQFFALVFIKYLSNFKKDFERAYNSSENKPFFTKKVLKIQLKYAFYNIFGRYFTTITNWQILIIMFRKKCLFSIYEWNNNSDCEIDVYSLLHIINLLCIHCSNKSLLNLDSILQYIASCQTCENNYT